MAKLPEEINLKTKVDVQSSEKPGWQTTEFWQTIGNQVAGLVCVLIAVLGLDADNPNAQLLIVSGLALMGVQGVGYGIARAIVKKAAQPKVYYYNSPDAPEKPEKK